MPSLFDFIHPVQRKYLAAGAGLVACWALAMPAVSAEPRPMDGQSGRARPVQEQSGGLRSAQGQAEHTRSLPGQDVRLSCSYSNLDSFTPALTSTNKVTNQHKGSLADCSSSHPEYSRIASASFSGVSSVKGCPAFVLEGTMWIWWNTGEFSEVAWRQFRPEDGGMKGYVENGLLEGHTLVLQPRLDGMDGDCTSGIRSSHDSGAFVFVAGIADGQSPSR